MQDTKVVRDILRYVEDMRSGEMIQHPPFYTKKAMYMQGVDVKDLRQVCTMLNAYVLKSYESVSVTQDGYVTYSKKSDVSIEWGVSGVKEELLVEEKEKLTALIKSEAQNNPAFDVTISKKEYTFIKDNISNVVIKDIDEDDDWYCIGKDK